jgi:homoserine O-acetyltransferase/O-succinyltransferase
MNALQTFNLGDLVLQSGEVLTNAKLAYLTVGRLNRARDNVVVMPTYYTGNHSSYLPLIGAGRALDPARYFIVIPNMFGNGVSSSPSNRVDLEAGHRFPLTALYDNVRQQARLVFEELGAREVALVCGWSMGGMQAYQWAVLYPDRVRRLLPFCAAARVSPYNFVFLEGLKAALQADGRWRDGQASEAPTDGLRAFGRVYAGWAYSHQFFRDGLYRQLGYANVEELLQAWEAEHLAFHADDLLAMLASWQHADISANAVSGGDFARSLAAIRARTILVPCSTDRYFPPADNEYEAGLIPGAELCVLDSPFGHCALSPGRVPAAMEFLDGCLARLLE